MNEETRQLFIEAGKKTAEIREFGRQQIKKGASVTQVSDEIEAKIRELGASPAFPAQYSCNHIAAHFCADPDNEFTFSDELVSMDVGVTVNGGVGDTAYTVDLSGKYTDLVKAAQQALKEALKVVGVGVSLGEIGKSIQDTIQSYGYRPVKNLSGHGIGLFDIHTTPSVPNYDNGDPTKLQEGQVIAIEPFATDGKGVIHEAGEPTVFMLTNKKSVRSPITRSVLKKIETYGGLPFAKRWLTTEFGAKANFALREMTQLGMIERFPPLVEVEQGVVAQAEHTVLIEEEPVILTQ